MRKYISYGERHWVTNDFISLMKEKLGSLVSRLPDGGYHVYPDMTGSHELFFIPHEPIPEVAKKEKIWEVKFHPGYKDNFLFFIETILKKEKMPRERLVTKADFSSWSVPKTASRVPSGQYGYTKAIEAMCTGANRRLQKKARSIVKKAIRKDERVLDFLQTHSKRGKSLPAKIMIRAYRDSIPKLASKIACEGGVCTCGGSCGCHDNQEDNLPEADVIIMKHALKKQAVSRELLRQKLRHMFMKFNGRISKTTLKKEISKLQREMRLSHPREIHVMIAQLKRERVIEEAGGNLMWVRGRMASLKESNKRKYGMYGFLQKTANLALQACSDLRMEAGHIASDLHMRKTDKYGSITGFLSQHGKIARCVSSKLLLSVYPEENMFKSASNPDRLNVNEWLSYEPEP